MTHRCNPTRPCLIRNKEKTAPEEGSTTTMSKLFALLGRAPQPPSKVTQTEMRDRRDCRPETVRRSNARSFLNSPLHTTATGCANRQCPARFPESTAQATAALWHADSARTTPVSQARTIGLRPMPASVRPRKFSQQDVHDHFWSMN